MNNKSNLPHVLKMVLILLISIGCSAQESMTSNDNPVAEYINLVAHKKFSESRQFIHPELIDELSVHGLERLQITLHQIIEGKEPRVQEQEKGKFVKQIVAPEDTSKVYLVVVEADNWNVRIDSVEIKLVLENNLIRYVSYFGFAASERPHQGEIIHTNLFLRCQFIVIFIQDSFSIVDVCGSCADSVWGIGSVEADSIKQFSDINLIEAVTELTDQCTGFRPIIVCTPEHRRPVFSELVEILKANTEVARVRIVDADGFNTSQKYFEYHPFPLTK